MVGYHIQVNQHLLSRFGKHRVAPAAWEEVFHRPQSESVVVEAANRPNLIQAQLRPDHTLHH